MTFKNPIVRRGYALCVLAQVTQIIANEGKLRFLWVHRFNAAYPFDGLRLEDITSKTIDSIRWINDDSTIPKAFHDCLDMTWLWIYWMKVYQHNGIGDRISKNEQMDLFNMLYPFVKIGKVY